MIRNRFFLVALILCLCIGVDLGTKTIARETLTRSLPQYYLSGALRLSPWENIGSTMSAGGHLPPAPRFWAFTVVAGAVAAGIIMFVLAWPGLKILPVVAGSLMAGGALSNVIDRLLHEGRVLDFINILIAPLDMMIFNFADVAIALGAILLTVAVARRLIGYSSRRI